MFKASTTFDKLLDKATSLTNLEPDWATIMQICDAIRQDDVQPRVALAAIKKKLNAPNPNVQLMALVVLEACVKNCSSKFHYEIATKEFMEEFHGLLKCSNDPKVKNEILRMVQAWAHVFRKEPSYKAIQDEMRLMKAEGFQFPALKESEAMFVADMAPEWSDGERCNRCRLQFSVVNRKHHCRHCGQVFCSKCSSKTSTIPKFGMEREVRVCDGCYDRINSRSKIDIKSVSDETKVKTTGAGTGTNANESPAKTKTEQEIQEEEELQLALALSKSEAESREHETMRQYHRQRPSFNNNTSGTGSGSQNAKSHKKSSKSNKSSSKSGANKPSKSKTDLDLENEDPELARYLNRNYWEGRANSIGDYENSPSPSAPQPSLSGTAAAKTQLPAANDLKLNKNIPGLDVDDQELETYTKNLRSTIEIFVNRLNSNKLRGRPITNDSGVQALFLNLTNMHPHLMMYMQKTSEARSNCERLQDKINQIRDARAALDALRDEHREQMEQAAAEAERLRQQQMAQKLEIMRKKKQEYLQYQRQLALQRMQEQERELMIRTEQLKFQVANPQPVGQWGSPILQQQPGYQQVPTMNHTNAGYYHPMPVADPNHPGAASYPVPGMMPQQQQQPQPQGYPPVTNPVSMAQPMMPPHMAPSIPPAPHMMMAPPPPSNQFVTGGMVYMPGGQQHPVANAGYPMPAEMVPNQYGAAVAQQQPAPPPQPEPQQPPAPVQAEVKEEPLINFD